MIFLLACTPKPVLESDRGPAMVPIAAGAVKMGMRPTPPVPGFTAPLAPPAPMASRPDLGAAPGGAPGGAPHGQLPIPDPPPPREVEVDAFYIDITEVTQAEYADFLADTHYRPPYVDEPWAEDGWNWSGSSAPRATADHPVVLTNWWDAAAYCSWAGKRLPTEAEWQLAVLGPLATDALYPWGDTYDGDKLNHGTIEPPNYDATDGWERTSPVASYPAGANGLYDGFGNAWEWTADMRVGNWNEVKGTQAGGRLKNPHTVAPNNYAAVRGGAYFFDLRPNPGGERSAFLVELRRKSTGFRCAKDGPLSPA